jgi:hypothetical protein
LDETAGWGSARSARARASLPPLPAPPAGEVPPAIGEERPSASPPSPNRPAPGKQGGPRFRPTWILGGLGIAIVVVMIAAALSAHSKGGNGGGVFQPHAPQALRASETSFQVILSWAPAGGQIQGYRVMRNSKALAFVTSPATTYTDDLALPGQDYVYSVIAYSSSGVWSLPAVVTVFTPSAAAGSARLTGVFRVNLHVASSFGINGMAGKEMGGFSYKPLCPAGPCDVIWVAMKVPGMRAHLSFDGSAYSGSVTTPFNMSCGTTIVPSTFTLTVRVLEGGVVGSRWVATRIHGTVSERTNAGLGCVASGIDYTFNGRLVH